MSQIDQRRGDSMARALRALLQELLTPAADGVLAFIAAPDGQGEEHACISRVLLDVMWALAVYIRYGVDPVVRLSEPRADGDEHTETGRRAAARLTVLVEREESGSGGDPLVAALRTIAAKREAIERAEDADGLFEIACDMHTLAERALNHPKTLEGSLGEAPGYLMTDGEHALMREEREAA